MLINIIGNVTNPEVCCYSTPDKGKIVVIPHVCNNLGVFNAGVAKAIREKWPKTYTKYMRHWLPQKMNPEFLLGSVQFVQVASIQNPKIRIIVANMFAQNKLKSKSNPRPLDYEALKTAMTKTVSLLGSLNTELEFHCPKFGCGLAGGYWPEIEESIKELWAKDHNVLIYTLGE